MQYIGTKEAARLVGVSPQTIRNLIAADDFAPAYRASPRRLVYEKEEIVAWIKRRELNKNMDQGAQ